MVQSINNKDWITATWSLWRHSEGHPEALVDVGISPLRSPTTPKWLLWTEWLPEPLSYSSGLSEVWNPAPENPCWVMCWNRSLGIWREWSKWTHVSYILIFTNLVLYPPYLSIQFGDLMSKFLSFRNEIVFFVSPSLSLIHIFCTDQIPKWDYNVEHSQKEIFLSNHFYIRTTWNNICAQKMKTIL